VRVLGIGHRHSRGLKAGVVVDLDDAEQVVRDAVAEAEHSAGVSIDEVFLSVSCGQLKSSNFVATVTIEGRVVKRGDVQRLMAAGRSFAERDGRTLLHMNRIGYRLDGTVGVRDPLGMAGKILAADLHAVTADDAPVRNLLLLVERCYLSAAGLVPASYASGLAATSEEERHHGVACIDMGAGTTTTSLFAEGHLLWTYAAPVGGNHLTFDIARSLSAPLAEAERIKTVYGTLAKEASADDEEIAYSAVGADAPAIHHVRKRQLYEVVSTRIRDLLGQVAERMERSGFARYGVERIVLTGGASRLAGIVELAATTLARPVRVGGPAPLEGLPVGLCSPAFSTAVGLVHAARVHAAGWRDGPGRRQAANGYLGRVGQWLRESF
jgi:cell division protein FtsA